MSYRTNQLRTSFSLCWPLTRSLKTPRAKPYCVVGVGALPSRPTWLSPILGAQCEVVPCLADGCQTFSSGAFRDVYIAVLWSCEGSDPRWRFPLSAENQPTWIPERPRRHFSINLLAEYTVLSFFLWCVGGGGICHTMPFHAVSLRFEAGRELNGNKLSYISKCLSSPLLHGVLCQAALRSALMSATTFFSLSSVMAFLGRPQRDWLMRVFVFQLFLPASDTAGAYAGTRWSRP
jgi:hypothetical protein